MHVNVKFALSTLFHFHNSLYVVDFTFIFNSLPDEYKVLR